MAKVQLTVQLEQEDKERLEQIAEEFDLSLSHIVRKAVKEYLEKLNK